MTIQRKEYNKMTYLSTLDLPTTQQAIIILLYL